MEIYINFWLHKFGSGLLWSVKIILILLKAYNILCNLSHFLKLHFHNLRHFLKSVSSCFVQFILFLHQWRHGFAWLLWNINTDLMYNLLGVFLFCFVLFFSASSLLDWLINKNPSCNTVSFSVSYITAVSCGWAGQSSQSSHYVYRA